MAYDKNDFGGEGYQSYLRKIRAIGNIGSKEEERRLIIAWQDEQCEKSREKLINSHLKYAASLIKKYSKNGIGEEDLVSIANIGLLIALDGFDRSKDVRLSTYALWWIRAELGNAVLNDATIARIPITNDNKKIFNNLSRVTEKITRENMALSAQQIDEAVAKELGTSIKKISDIRRIKMPPVSFDQPLSSHSESSNTLAESLSDTSSQSVDEILEEQDTKNYRKKLLQQAVKNLLSDPKNGLSKRNFCIFMRRTIEGDTLEVIANDMEISRERIRQIEVKTMQKISTEVKRLEMADQERTETRILSARSRSVSFRAPAPAN